MRKTAILLIVTLLLLAVLVVESNAPLARAVGETSTRFGIYVPPGYMSSREPILLVTAVQDDTQVDIVDDGGDGDADDTHAGIALIAGQSYVVPLSQGAVNDAYGAPSAGALGDYFVVTATRPVLAAHMTLNTDWQHDFLPADNRRMSGTSFYFFHPQMLGGATARLDVFAYNDHTRVQIIDVTRPGFRINGASFAGLTQVVSDTLGAIVLDYTLDTGEDLVEVHRQVFVPQVGHTYHVVSNKDVTVAYGAIGRYDHQSRDGGAYVPGKGGYSADKTFYFVLPFYAEREREMRIISYAAGAHVSVRGWDRDHARWDDVASYHLPAYGHVDLLGLALGAGHYLFEVTSNATISVFETNWLETTGSSYETADIGAFVSAADGSGAGASFQAYLGPPSLHQIGTGTPVQRTHLVIFARQAAQVTAQDTDAYGEYIELYNPTAAAVNIGGWTLTNAAGKGLVIPVGAAIPPASAYLLEFHDQATEVAAGFVYGPLFPAFRLDNGADSLTLKNGAAIVDSVAYAAAAWTGAISHPAGYYAPGVYWALERADPGQPFTSSNYQDGSAHHAKSAANLGDYYGSPGQPNPGAPASGSSVVINEVMAGRFYSAFTVPTNGYHDVALTIAEWEGLHNGERPASPTGNPETPYLLVQSDQPISVFNGNWNDNWMTYGAGVLLPDPRVNYVADYYRREIGEPVTFTAYVEDRAATLYSPITAIRVPAGIQYTPGSYETPAQIAGVTPTEALQPDGSWLITWNHGQNLPPGDIYRFRVTGTVQDQQPTGTALSSVAAASGDDGAGQTFASQDTAAVIVDVDEKAGVTDVVINEVLYQPSTADAWIELYNQSTSAVDIGGWELHDEHSFLYRIPPQTFIPNDGYIRVHLSAGPDTLTDLFAGPATLGDPEGRLSLYANAVHDPTTLVDFVQWDDDGNLTDPAADDLAAQAGLWPNGGWVQNTGAGQSLGRDRNATDAHVPADWENTGGVDSTRPTPGARNFYTGSGDVTPPGPATELTAVPTLDGRIVLRWVNPPDSDFRGNKVLRRTDRYPVHITDGAVAYQGDATGCADTGLAPFTTYYYTVFSYDADDNYILPNGAPRVKAVSARTTVLAYEDLKGAGWNDWDTNDLVVKQQAAFHIDNADRVVVIEAVISATARGACYDHAMTLTIPFRGAAAVVVERRAADATVLTSTLTPAVDGLDLRVFPSTRAALPPGPDGCNQNTTLGDTVFTPGQSVYVRLTLGSPASNVLGDAAGDLTEPPFDPWILVLNTGQAIHLVGSGSVGNTQTVVDATSPLYGRDLPLALSFPDQWYWPLNEHAIWLAYPSYSEYITSGHQSSVDWYTHPVTEHVWALAVGVQPGTTAGATTLRSAAAPLPVRDTTSTPLTGWPQNTGAPVFGSPILVDLDGDTAPELVVSSQDGGVYVWEADGSAAAGWPQGAPALVRSSPAVGDVDGNGDQEVLVAATNGRVYGWRHDGTPLSAPWPVQLGSGSPIKSTPALADLDGDGAAEVIVHGGDGYVYVLRGSGAAYPGWPRATGESPESYGDVIMGSSPAVGDVDGDLAHDLEIVVGGTDGQVYAWHDDGAPLAGWPQATGDRVYASPVIADLNGDGWRDVVVGSGDGRLYAWRGDGEPLWGFPFAAAGAIVGSPAVGDVDGNGDLEVAFGTLRGRVYLVHHDGYGAWNWPQLTLDEVWASPALADVDGDGRVEVIVGSKDNRLYAWRSNGLLADGWPRALSDWLISSPAVGDLNGDGNVNVAVGCHDGRVYAWDETRPYDANRAPWPAFRQDPARRGVLGAGAPNPLPTPAVPTPDPSQVPAATPTPRPAIHTIYLPCALRNGAP